MIHLTPHEAASIPLGSCVRCGRKAPAVALAERGGICGWCLLTPAQAPAPPTPTPLATPTPPQHRLVHDEPCGVPLQDRWTWPGMSAAQIREATP